VLTVQLRSASTLCVSAAARQPVRRPLSRTRASRSPSLRAPRAGTAYKGVAHEATEPPTSASGGASADKQQTRLRGSRSAALSGERSARPAAAACAADAVAKARARRRAKFRRSVLGQCGAEGRSGQPTRRHGRTRPAQPREFMSSTRRDHLQECGAAASLAEAHRARVRGCTC
jgi:hypothetical protein